MYRVLSLLLLVGVALAQDPLVRCKRPLCRMFCDNGFQTDESGCQICECQSNPCEDYSRQVCPADTGCRTKPCTDHPCTELAHECFGDMEWMHREPTEPAPVEPEPPMCAMPMCATDCPNGYANDANGCMTCTCVTKTCEDLQCEAEDDVCVIREEHPTCAPRSLCMENQASLRSVDCEDNGEFSPMQCDNEDVCWCVDDQGREIPGTRMEGGAQPNCKKNATSVLHVEVVVIHEFISISDHRDGLESAVKQHVGQWLMVQEEDITVIEIRPHDVREIFIHVTVVSDGTVDLPSASHRLQRRMKQGRCDIPYHGRVLRPAPNTLNVTHEYEKPRLPEHPLVEPTPTSCWGRWHRYAHGHKLIVILSLSGLLFILLVITVTCVIVAKKKRSALQFRHKRLDNMETFKKNLVLSSDMQLPADLISEKSEKPPGPEIVA